MGNDAAGGRVVRMLVLRLALSCLGGGLFYLGWLALSLLTMEGRSALWDAAVWALGPLLTALGLAAGVTSVTLREALDHIRRGRTAS
jgi:hypothetical protein